MKKRFLLALVAVVGMLGVFTSCSKDKEPEGDVLCNLTVSGSVLDDKGAAVSGVKVQIYRETTSGAWSLIGSATSNSSGNYTMSKASIVVVIGNLKAAVAETDKYSSSEIIQSVSSVDYTGGDRQLFAGTAKIEGMNISLTSKEE